MEGKRLIEKIRLRNILSFGDKGEEITLEPLNIIIGQNASGKSNLIDVIKLLKSSTQEKGFANEIAQGGGVNEWIWKGDGHKEIAEAIFDIEIKFDPLLSSWDEFLSYEIDFWRGASNRLEILGEVIKNKEKKISLNRDEFLKNNASPNRLLSDETLLSVLPKTSITGGLARPSIMLTETLSRIKVFNDLNTGRNSSIREAQNVDFPDDFLLENASNLSLILNDLIHKGSIYETIVENLKKFNPKVRGYAVKLYSGSAQLYLREENLDESISAKRLSDGTLRYLCLLAILCHPEPPPLICIEEPETGLHPDILPTIAELMKDAAQRTQLIVTTHSDILVSAFSDMPEAVMVCENDEDGTHFKRLDADKLKVWLEEYTLGEAWLRGAIGGTRW